MKFSEFLLLTETQTISQYLKTTKEFTQDQIQQAKNQIRGFLLQQQILTQDAKKLIDPLINFFTYLLLKGNITNKAQIRNFWEGSKDFLIAHRNDQKLLGKLNSVNYTQDQFARDDIEWHEKLALKKATPGAQGIEVINLDNIGWKGWKWVSLGKSHCPEESRAAGHCGNQAYKKGDNILSLRDPENKVHLTFIVNNKVLGESKGKGNNKPSPKYHLPIVQLLMSDLIDSIHGGGYLPQNNFHFSDLSPDLQKRIKSKKKFIDSIFDYYSKDKDKLAELFHITDFKEIINDTVVVENFDSLKEIYDFLKNKSFGSISDFSWIDEPIDVDINYSDIKEYVKYLTKENETKLRNRFPNYEIIDLIENNEEISDAFLRAIINGLEIGTQNEAWKDLTRQLSKIDEIGFYFDFQPFASLKISLKDLKNAYTQFGQDIEEGRMDFMELVKTTYKEPHYGYHDFDEKEFNEKLKEELNEIK